MKRYRHLSLAIAACLVWAGKAEPVQAQSAVRLPDGVKAVWNMAKAYREATPTRERICLNGLWRWQPAREVAGAVPANSWGYFKVPGCWPGITDYMQKDCQTVYSHPSWRNERLRNIAAAWYQREIVVPAKWTGRRIAVSTEYLNSYAAVYVDGTKAGEMRFPGGEVDLTSVCRPGGTYTLSILVVAMPLKGVMLSYTDTASAREVKGSVARRGLCGDVYLVSTTQDARIVDVKIDTSVRKWEVAFDVALENLDADERYALRARIGDKGGTVRVFTTGAFKAGDLKNGRIVFAEKWKPEKLWDIHTPQNVYDLQVSLLDAAGRTLDAAHPMRFGFREFWIDGRDFVLNGSRIFLSAVPLDNAQVGAAWANYEAAKESLLRLKSFGINFVYTHNYGCQPGSHLSFAEILKAADDVGMLVAFSQPHFSHYDWKAPDADANNGYARHAEFYVRVAQNHPSVVAYSMSHNATGYNEDMNPDMIDGIQNPRSEWSLRNSRIALRAEAIVKRLDPGRIVYHHAGGNIGAMHTSNFYPNFVPVQELSDWFEHWATEGVKPAFTCEYGGPFTWDWTMYRGWYKGKREFGSAVVPWEFCLAEWNSQFLGDRAFRISEMEKRNLRWEARQFRAGRTWHRWDYPHVVGSRDFDERYPVMAMYMTDNWRAFRTWGLSANSPWQHGHYWKMRDGVDKNRKDLPVDWETLQRPGFSADYIDRRYERMDLAFERSDWIPTAAAQALIRNNRPLLAYIGGKPARFTSKDHNFCPGETVEKQLILINNSRETVTCDCKWSFGLPQAIAGSQKVSVPTGEQKRVPLRFNLPPELTPGRYELTATVKFSTNEIQKDAFAIHVLPQISSTPSPPSTHSTPPTPSTPSTPSTKSTPKIALFDPNGETAKRLEAMGVQCQSVNVRADLSAYDIFIIGKAALTVDGPGPDVSRVHEGLKVIVFEQTAEVLEKRFGFRVAEYGLRQVFKRVPDHPVLAGLDTENLRDWRGEATILPPHLKYELSPRYNGAPAVKWCDIEVTRAWRCGCRGNVASVLIEKPVRGDFLPIVDGGYSLQYSPLLEYREGKGMVLFCQMDVTGRTEEDPAATRLLSNILSYPSHPSLPSDPSDSSDPSEPSDLSDPSDSSDPSDTPHRPPPTRAALYAGDPAGKRHLEFTGISVGSYEGEPLSPDQVLIVGPGGGRNFSANAAAIADWLKAGGHVLAIGLDEQDANAFLPFRVRMKKEEHIAAFFEPPGIDSLLTGIGPADVHNRDPRELPLVSEGAAVIANGVLAKAENANVVFCQLAPWQFDYRQQHHLKRTYRRTSFLVTRLLANMGVAGSTPLLSRFHTPVDTAKREKRWLNGLYLDIPEEWDDPYRFFRW